MRRREFLIVGGMAASPFAVRAQPTPQMRRIGVLMNRAADDREGQTGIAAFKQALQQFGWTDSANVRFDIRWGEDDLDTERRYATELVGLAPDIVLAGGTMSVGALQKLSRVLPIVFVGVTDPAGAGFIDSLARPGGNTTGFMLFEYGFTSKWLELLKQIEPSLKRAGVLRDATNPASLAQFGAIQAVAPSLGVEVISISLRDAAEIDRAVAGLANSGSAGLIVTPSAGVSAHSALIIALATRHKLPAVYGSRLNVNNGGLIFYGPDRIDQFRRAAGYVDRILKGEKAAELPVQVPTKYELIINMKAAKAIDLALPAGLLARADEVIE
jgi:putative ABC transport system substrate-binding protein